jgi:hypothetical protein
MHWTRLPSLAVIAALLVAAALACKQNPREPEAESKTARVDPAPSAGTEEPADQEAAAKDDDHAGDEGSVELDREEYEPPEPPSKSEPGPNLGTTSIYDDDISSLEDLRRLYPLPEGYEYDLASWGQPVIRRGEDDATFSFTAGGRMVTFDYRRRGPSGGIGYDTSEVFHVEDAADCPKEEWEVEGGGCVTGFANEE